MKNTVFSQSNVERTQFYLDENVDRRIVEGLREKGITLITAEEQGLKGEKDDAIHLKRATELGCVLVTMDQDFGMINKAIAQQWAENPDFWHAGIVFVTSPRSPGKLIEQLEEIYKTKQPEDMINLFWPI